MNWGKRVAAPHARGRASRIYGALHGMKKGVKDVVAPQGLFEDLGLKYIGPVDGHDEQELEFALRARQGLPRTGHRPRHHPQGPRATRPRSATRPTASTAWASSTRTPASR